MYPHGVLNDLFTFFSYSWMRLIQTNTSCDSCSWLFFLSKNDLGEWVIVYLFGPVIAVSFLHLTEIYKTWRLTSFPPATGCFSYKKLCGCQELKWYCHYFRFVAVAAAVVLYLLTQCHVNWWIFNVVILSILILSPKYRGWNIKHNICHYMISIY